MALLVGQGAALAQPLVRVEARRVCMVNDTLFPKDQIAVEVDGRTYFGCCDMCKGRLANDATARRATDPVSGRPVDKAMAVIGARPDGTVLYFESEHTFEEYAKRT
jgi:YHS domain-containing protein